MFRRSEAFINNHIFHFISLKDYRQRKTSSARAGVISLPILDVRMSVLFFASSMLPNTNQQMGVALAGAAGLLAIALWFTGRSEEA